MKLHRRRDDAFPKACQRLVLLVAGCAFGCAGTPQHPVPGCVHPVAELRWWLEDLHDGFDLEHGQKRMEQDTTHLRLHQAGCEADVCAQKLNRDFEKLICRPKPAWIP